MHLVLEMPGKAIILVLYLSITKSLFGEGGGLTTGLLLNYKLLPAEWLGGWKHRAFPSEIAHYRQTSLVWSIYTCTYGYSQIIHIFLVPLTEKYCQVKTAWSIQCSTNLREPRLPSGASAQTHPHKVTPAAPMNSIHQESGGKKEQEKHPRCAKTSPWCPGIGGLQTFCARHWICLGNLHCINFSALF